MFFESLLIGRNDFILVLISKDKASHRATSFIEEFLG